MSGDTTTVLLLRSLGRWIIAAGIPLIVETVAWTLSLCSFILLCALQQKTLSARNSKPGTSRLLLMGTLTLMFLLSTLVFACDLHWFFVQVKSILLEANTNISPAAEGVILRDKTYILVTVVPETAWIVAMFLGDGIVLWRAWVMTSGKNALHKLVIVPAACLLAYLVTSPILLKCVAEAGLDNTSILGFSGHAQCHDILRANLALSLTSNFLSTCILMYIGWNHRLRMRQSALDGTGMSMAQKIVQLLYESGLIYFVVNLIWLLLGTYLPASYSLRLVMIATLTGVMNQAPAMTALLTYALVLWYGSVWDTSRDDKVVQSRIQFARPIPPRASSLDTSTYNDETPRISIADCTSCPDKEAKIPESV